MSAMNPVPSSGASTEKRSYEPSMEEILASIRRIIADDQSLPGRGGTARESETQTGFRSPDVPQAAPQFGSDPQVGVPHSRTAEAEEPNTASHTAGQSAGDTHGAASLEQSPAGRPSPIQWATPEPVDEAEPAPTNEPARSFAADSAGASTSAPSFRQPLAYGAIAAPQYAGPGGNLPSEEPEEAIASGGGAADPAPTERAPIFHEAVHDEYTGAEPISAAHDRFEEPIEPFLPQQSLPELQPLFSSATDSSVSSAFNVLAASRLAANSDEIMNLVREMLRPLLRNWLDDNLPSMVERMVRDEIERVARGGR